MKTREHDVISQQGGPLRSIQRSGVVFLLLLALVARAGSQSKTGTTVGQFLLIEPSARLTAMGNAGTATFQEVECGYYNPAAWGHLERSDAQFSYTMWLADIVYDYAAVGIRTDALGTFVLTLTSLNSGEIDVRTVEQPLGTGERYSVSNTAIGVGYGFALTDRFSAGAQLSYIQETIWHSSLKAFAVNFGAMYQVSENGLLIGASISNFGTRSRYSGTDVRIRFDSNPDVYGDNSNLPGEAYTESFPLPILFRVGLALPLSLGQHHQFWLTADAFHPSDNTESVSFGAEWTFMKMVSLRAGYQQLFQEDSEVGLTLGAGFEYDLIGYPLHFDYAWADHGRLASTQRLTFGVRF
jgi:long-subunit fatty acid transport protein